MTHSEIVRHRLINQQLVEHKFSKPREIVAWLGAMQAQEYAMSKWAIGLRLNGKNEDDIEKAFNKGEILRTHLLRPTWHFVSATDIRWMLMLTSPQVHAVNKYYYKKAELDKKILNRCTDILARNLEGENFLTRDELTLELGKAKIQGDGLRLASIFMYAELEAIICSGPRKGKQFSYALLNERAPLAKSMDRGEALQVLMKRFFTSRGPASLKDFTYWSAIPMKDAKAQSTILKNDFEREVVNGEEVFFKPIDISKPIKSSAATFLMPDYDEYGMSYKDRSAMAGDLKSSKLVYNRLIIVDGQAAGSWRRTIKNSKIIIETDLFQPLTKAKSQALDKAIKKFTAFTGKEIAS